MAFDSGSTFVIRAVGALGPLVALFLISSAVEPQLFGLWAALASLTLGAAFADLGAGNFLISTLPPILSRGEYAQSRSLVRDAYVKTCWMSVVSLVVALAVTMVIGMTPSLSSVRWESIGVALATLVPFALWITLQLGMRLLFVLGRAPLANLSQLLMNVAAVGLVALGTATGAQIGWLALAYSLPQTVGLLAINLYVFRRWREQVSPRAAMRRPTSLWTILPFASVTAFPLMFVAAQPAIVGIIGGVAAAGPFSLIWRPVTAISTLLLGALNPLWVVAAEGRLTARVMVVAYSLVIAVSAAAGTLAALIAMRLATSSDHVLALGSVTSTVLLSVSSLGGVILATTGRVRLYASLFVALLASHLVYVVSTSSSDETRFLWFLSIELALLAAAVTAAAVVAWRGYVVPGAADGRPPRRAGRN